MELFFHERDAAMPFRSQSQTKTFPFNTREGAYKLGMLVSSRQMEVSHTCSISVFPTITQSTHNRFL